MLKLFKHNSKYLYKSHIIMVGILFINILLCAILTAITKTYNDQTAIVLNVILNFLYTITSLIMVSLVIVSFIMILVNFRRKVLGDEGYLTHTLPLSKRQIVNSYYLTALVYLIADIIVILLASFFLNLINKDFSIYLGFSINSGQEFLIAFLVVILLIILFFLYFSYVLLAYVLGYSKPDKKTRNTVLFGILIYLANQVINSIPLAIIISTTFKIDPTLIDNFIWVTLLILCLYYLLITLVSYILINRTLKNKLNLE